MNERLREELKTMAAEDRRLRQELLENGELGDGYAPRMEALHRKNTARLKDIVVEHGWPDRDLVGEEGTQSAWFIAQHAISDPEFQRQALKMIGEKVSKGSVPAAQEAYLFDRIAMYEGRPQRYGTQSLPFPDGKYRRWQTEDPQGLNQRRISIGLPPVPDDPPESEPTAQLRAKYDHCARGYAEWLRRTGWRS